jgi:hypothetical protein
MQIMPSRYHAEQKQRVAQALVELLGLLAQDGSSVRLPGMFGTDPTGK